MSDDPAALPRHDPFGEELELLQHLLASEGFELPRQETIPRRGPGEPPLSFAQSRLWFLEQWQPGTATYNLPTAYRLEIPLDFAALEFALAAVQRRHEVLRTTFVMREAEPVQRIAPGADLRAALVDLQSLPGVACPAEVARLLTAEARRPFDLARGPLWRVAMLRLAHGEQVLLSTMHHIITDGWSLRLLLREIQALAAAFTLGAPPSLPELPIQYADYAVWQRQWLTGAKLERLLDFWREQLADPPPLLELPTDRPRTAMQTSRGASRPLCLASGLGKVLRAVGQPTGATTFMVLLAAFATLLHRYTGQEDVVIGSPIANRNRMEVEPLIGLFVNTLPLRIRLSSEIGFLALLERVKPVVLGAYDHQDLPFEKLVEELGVDRSPSHTPLFQVALTFADTAESREADLIGLEVEPGAVKFDLALNFMEPSLRSGGAVGYRSDLFDANTIARLVGHFGTLLDGIAADPVRPLASLPLLTEAERAQLLGEWSGLSARHPPDCLHRRFEARAELAPEAVAVVAEGSALTFRELDRRAGRLARRLRVLGVGAESPVGLCVEPSLATLVGIVGILKAGGAYVPLDPSYPPERLALLLADAAAPVVVTVERHVPDLQAGGAAVVVLDRGEEVGAEPAGGEAGLSGDGALPESPAYILYTSGSTGRPKGVVVPHACVTALLDAAAERFGFGAGDVWTLFHSFAFDFSVWEIWGALLEGGRLVVVPRAVSRSPEGFHEILRRERVTILNQTPSAFQPLLRADERAPEAGRLALRWLIFGGEALDPRLLAPWIDRHGDRHPRLVNMYGITETTVHVTWRTVGARDLDAGGRSPIGRPLPGQRAHVLDHGLELAPVGVRGEIHVGGTGLARGYLRDPRRTAERFVPDPFSVAPGGRLYRSGDLARRRPDGGLEYLGRADHQVKIRGFRIETGEVESALRQHPGLDEVAVSASLDAAGETRLTAYFTAVAGVAPGIEELRADLRAKLPDYMVPRSFVRLEALPRTATGKLDRSALPAPGPERPELEQAWVAPRSPAEEVMAQVWAQVLGLDRVGVHDNFFALGGDSILSLRVRTLAEERGLAFTLQQLFANQTVAELVQAIKATSPEALPAAPQAFELLAATDRARLPDGLEDAYPLTAMQAGMLFHMGYRPEAIVYHNVYSYHLQAKFDLGAFETAVSRAVARHPILRTSFDLETGSEPLQRVHRQVALPVEVEDLRHLPPAEQGHALDAFVKRETQRRFDFARAPLLRLCLHRRGEDSFNLTLTECHPIFDGWSLHSFLVEVLETYFALAGGEPAPEPPPLRLAVRDFVALERAAAESAEARAYWDAKLRHAAVLKLPREAPERGDKGGGTRALAFPVPGEVLAGLKALARTVAVPFKSVLLAAHLKVMSRLKGHGDVLTGLLVNGRPEGPDGDLVLGLFFNVVPFRLEVGRGTWADLVRATFDAEREMLPFRRYPLAPLQAARGGAALFEVIFNYLHFHMLRKVLASGQLEVLGDVRRFEENSFPLSIAFLQDAFGERLTLLLRYDAGQFGVWQIEGLRALFASALRAMSEAPMTRHDAGDLLSEPERHRQRLEWNDAPHALRPSPRPAPRPESFHRRFEAVARRSPGALAVVATEGSLRYGELDARAGRLARRLRRAGIGPESLVAIHARRSLETVVAILAVLKAGGAYVPLDPRNPPERTAALLADAGIALILGGEPGAGSPAPGNILHLGRDGDREPQEEEDAHDPEAEVPLAAAAYVLFTSGSTGRPKGVVVEHRQLAHYLDGILDRLDLAAGSSFALASTLAADLGHTAFFPALATGGCLHLVSEEQSADAAAFADFCSRHPADLLKIVPSHLAALLAAAGSERILPRRRLVLGGEALDWRHVDRVRALAPDCEILNHYGPTETTVGVATHRVTAEATARGATVPLGRPLSGTRLHVLDGELQPLPAGMPGELHAGGGGLARGYLRDPAATAERFVPHPGPAEPGARLYRTGDLAHHLPDGALEFLGRVDDQVKIRGFRVELAEVEAVLARHPGVREAAVAARRDGVGELRLVAYVVAGTADGGDPASSPAPGDAELRGFLRRHLPEPMLPSAWVRLAALPRTANGKLDRAALPEARELVSSWSATYVAPRNALEATIAAVWREVLRLEKVGVDDNFLDLGGHSLFMLRVHGLLRQALGRDLHMVTLFEHPTVGALAAHLSGGETGPGPAMAGPTLSGQDEAGVRARARHAAFARARATRPASGEGEP